MKKLIYIIVLLIATNAYAFDKPIALEAVGNIRAADFGTISETGNTDAHDYGQVASGYTCYFDRTGSKNVTVKLQAELLNPIWISTDEGPMIAGFKPWTYIDLSGEHTITSDAATHVLTTTTDIDAQYLRIKIITGADGSNTISPICNSTGE